MAFPKSRAEVYNIAAALFSKIRAWHKETFSEFKTELSHEDREQMPEEVRSLYEELDDFLDCIAAHPEYRDFVSSWMFEVSCNQPIHTTEEEVEKVGLEEFLSTIGGMYRKIDNWFMEVGGSVTERCISKHGWSMGTACTEDEINTYCDEMYESFSEQIMNGTLSVRKVFYCNRLIGLTTENYKEYLGEDDPDVIGFQPDKGLRKVLGGQAEDSEKVFQFEVETRLRSNDDEDDEEDDLDEDEYGDEYSDADDYEEEENEEDFI